MLAIMAFTAMSTAALAASCNNGSNANSQPANEQQCCNGDDNKQCCKQRGDRPTPPKQMTPDERTQHMVDQLGLDDSQAAQLKQLNNDYADVFNFGGPGHPGGRPPKMDGNNGNKDEKPAAPPQLTDEQKQQMQQMKEKRDQYEAKLKQILTDDQLAKYQQMHRQRPGGPRNRNDNSNK